LIVRIVAGAPTAYLNFDSGYVIAVDKGVKHCLSNNIKIDLAVGDFDSYDKKLVKAPMIELNQEKDETDLFVALMKAIEMKPEKIFIYGATNGRYDHFHANINLLGLYDITIIDEVNTIYVKSSSFNIVSDKYISFFNYSGVPVLSLSNFKYPLKNYKLEPKDNLCVSNEVVNTGTVDIKGGSVLIIETTKED